MERHISKTQRRKSDASAPQRSSKPIVDLTELDRLENFKWSWNNSYQFYTTWPTVTLLSRCASADVIPSALYFRTRTAISYFLISFLRFLTYQISSGLMAVFGFNLTVSIVGLFFLRKLIPAFDFPSKLLTGFYRFYAPSENDCRQAAQLKPKTVKASKKNQNVQSKEFVIPKVWVNFNCIFSNHLIQDAEVPLYFAQVKADDWSFLHFYPEFCWLVEFSITTLFVLAVTEAVPRYLIFHYLIIWQLYEAILNGEVTPFQMNSICLLSGSSLLACFVQLTWRDCPRSLLEAQENAAW